MQQFTPKKEKSKTQNVRCKKSNTHTLKTHLIVSLSSPHFSVPHPHNSNRNTHTPRLGGERILKTNKQRIDLLRRIAEVLITSDPSPLLSKNAPLSSLILSSIYVSTLISHPPLCQFGNLLFQLWIFSKNYFFVTVEAPGERSWSRDTHLPNSSSQICESTVNLAEGFTVLPIF